MVLPQEDGDTPAPPWKLDPVKEGMHYYYCRWPEELQKLLERLRDERKRE
jgi:hypothetical protein